MVTYKIKIEQKEQNILKEIILANNANIKKRKSAITLSSLMAIVMLIYTILCFSANHIVSGIIGLLFSVFFLWIIAQGSITLQRKLLNILYSKTNKTLVSGNREYCFDTDGIKISSDIGNSHNYWNAYKCWGIFQNYIYIKSIQNDMILINQDDLSEKDLSELKILLEQNLKEDSEKA